MPLLTVRLPPDATLATALQELQLTSADVDIAYGLILVDPELGLYALRVTDAAAARMSTDPPGDAQIFADPRIQPGAGSGEDPEPIA